MQALRFAVILTVFTTAFCRVDFNCDFESEDYKKQLAARDPGDYIWGEYVEPLEFKTFEELSVFVNEIDDLKKKFNEENVLDNFDSYIDIFNEFSNYKASAETNESDTKESILQTFIGQYQPDSTYPDSLGLLLKFFKEAIQKTNYTNLEKHIFITAGSDSSKLEEVKTMRFYFPARFSLEYIVGLIKISVNGEIGYVIIDMEYQVSSVPFVMEDDPRPKYLEGDHDQNDKPIVYHLVGTYIECSRYKYDAFSDSFLRELVTYIYIRRPLCNVEEAHYRATLVQTSRLSILKFDGDSKLEASLYANIPGKSLAADVYNLGYERNGFIGRIDFQDLKEVENDPLKQVLFKEAEKLLGLEKHDSSLSAKISSFQRILPQLEEISRLEEEDYDSDYDGYSDDSDYEEDDDEEGDIGEEGGEGEKEGKGKNEEGVEKLKGEFDRMKGVSEDEKLKENTV